MQIVGSFLFFDYPLVLIMNIVTICTTVFLFCEANLANKVFAIFLCNATQILSKFIYTIVIMLIFRNKEPVNASYYLFEYVAALVFLNSTGFLVSAIIKRQKATSYYQKRSSVLLLFPVTHILIISIAMYFISEVSIASALDITISTLAIFCFLLDFYILYIVDNIEKIENNAIELEKRLLKNELNYEQMQIVRDEKKEISKIRHDAVNILSTAYGFLEIGNIDKALCILKELHFDFSHSYKMQGSFNETINIVISIKESQASDKGISLVCNVEESHATNIDDYDLCRLLMNQIDNAINAVVKTDSKQIFIKLYTDSEIFRIEIENAYCIKYEKKAIPPNRGHGIQIINEIAKKYEGEYFSEKNNGIFHSTVVLKNPDIIKSEDLSTKAVRPAIN